MASSYAAGVLYAVASGICHNLGLLLQKRAVNNLSPEEREAGFFARLLRRPLWLLGLATNFGAGTVFFLLAQVRIGPALIPGLMASGLIILVLGSASIAGDRLAGAEIAGAVLMAAGIALLGASRLAIDLREYDVLARGFLRRAALFSGAALFTGAALVMALAAYAVQRRGGPRRGVALALLSGLLYVLSDFWVGPFVAVTHTILARAGTAPHYLMFALCSGVLVLTNLFGIGTLQSAFRYCTAAQAVPIQNVPVQLAQVLVYLVVFGLEPPSPHSIPFMVVGVALITVSSFLLAARQVEVEERGEAHARTS
ncbi:MAG: hypothetical protein JW820_09880 [Spirochaetales bacterium]|nr:hypothetical protein [Spirochaetales bacterium]